MVQCVNDPVWSLLSVALVTAVVRVRSLSQELLHASGVAKKKKGRVRKIIMTILVIFSGG